MLNLNGVLARLGASGDLTKQVEADCAESVAQFRDAIAEVRRIGQLASKRALTVDEAGALADAITEAERRHSHIVSYAKALPAIARNRHQKSSPKGAKPAVTALIDGPIKAEFLAWRRGHATAEDYTPTSRARYDTFAEAMEKRHGVDAKTITNRITRERWLDEV